MTTAIIAAEFTTGSKARPATLAINRIANGQREAMSWHEVSGKREARAIAKAFHATPWNF